MIISVSVRNQMTRKTLSIQDSMTLAEAFNEAGIDPVGIITLSGTVVQRGDLDKTFADYGIAESAVLNVNAKTDNAAQIIMAGEVAIIKSAYSYEDIETLSKYSPKALVLTEKDDDGDKHTVFRVCTSAISSASKNGIEFAKTDSDTASVAVALPRTEAEKYVMDVLGPIAVKLGKLEEGFEAALAEVEATKVAIQGMITTI